MTVINFNHAYTYNRYSALQSQKAVTAYLKCEQLLPFTLVSCMWYSLNLDCNESVENNRTTTENALRWPNTAQMLGHVGQTSGQHWANIPRFWGCDIQNGACLSVNWQKPIVTRHVPISFTARISCRVFLFYLFIRLHIHKKTLERVENMQLYIKLCTLRCQYRWPEPSFPFLHPG